MLRKFAGTFGCTALLLLPAATMAQGVIIQEEPTIIQRIFAPVVETVETITAPVPNQAYAPSQTVITAPSRVVTTNTVQVIQTQTRINDPVFDALARQLRDILPDRRREAAFAMGQLRNPRAVPLLLDRLRVDLNKNVRKACVVAISQIPDPAIPGYLERVAIYDPNAEVRQLATNLMRKLTESVVVETPVEVPATTIIPGQATTIQTPVTGPIVGGVPATGNVQIQGGISPAASTNLRPRSPGAATEIISEPVQKPAVNPLNPPATAGEPALKQKEAAKPATKPADSAKTSGTTPVLSPPSPNEPPPLEVLPDEVPQNTRNNTPTKPRSA
ncbi:MAG: HEAT repeat domain-containing protein [Isosphaeraceae bacterium]